MPTHGLLKKVWDNAGHWGLIIEVDDHGEHRLNLWDKTFAGIDSKEHPAVCDVHNWEGMRIIYTAKKGKPKDDDPTDCWPATIEMIALEGAAMPDQSVREMAEALAASITPEQAAEIENAPQTPSGPQKSPDAYNLDRALMDHVIAASAYADSLKHLAESMKRNFPFGGG